MSFNINNKEIYDNNWNEWRDMKKYGPASRYLRTLISRLLNRVSNVSTILDIGCGEGTITNLISNKFPRSKIIGSDFSIEGIKIANNQYGSGNVKFIVDPDSKILDQRFDMITCFEVLEHVEEWKPFLERIQKSSKRYLLISTLVGKMRNFEKNVGHYRNFKKNEIEIELVRFGWKVDKALYAGFPFFSPIYRDLCQLTNSGSNNFTKGSYRYLQKFVANVIYILFALFSTRNNFGDQLCILFTRDSLNHENQ